MDSAESRTHEALLRYQQTIQRAFREVGDALVAYAKNGEFPVDVDKEALVATLRNAVDLANLRYQSGAPQLLLRLAELEMIGTGSGAA